jgi:carbamate kinase
MLPKVLAATRFADSKRGRVAVISSLAQAKGAMKGESGTKIVNSI